MPQVYRGVEQYPLSGVSMKYTFDAKPDDPTQKHVQYYAMLGTRAIWEDGWKAVAIHAPITGKGHFDRDRWELFNTNEDRAESRDHSKENPEKLKHLIDLWLSEAEKNKALPLDDRTALEQLNLERPTSEPPRERYVYYPGTAPIPEGVAVNVRNRSFKILSNLEVTDASCSGTIFTMGSRFGGHTLFIRNNKLYYVYNFLGIKPEQKLISSVPLGKGKHTVGVEFTREKTGQFHESVGTVKLYINDKVVAQGPMRTQAGKFGLGGGMRIGYNSADPVSAENTRQGSISGAIIQFVGFTVEKTEYVDLEQEAKRAMMAN
jgi:arylsulfatase